MPTPVNDDGQPLNRSLNWQRLQDSRLDELIGLCRGVLADGVLAFEEVKFLRQWLDRNPPVTESFVGPDLCCAIDRVLSEGQCSGDAERQLLDVLTRIMGGTPIQAGDASFSSTLPLDDPAPPVSFEGRSFCFTGKFKHGTRSQCQDAVILRGAAVEKSPTRATDYVVIGEIGSRDWAHSSMGRKIEKAIELRTEGLPVKIISEQHWLSFLDRP